MPIKRKTCKQCKDKFEPQRPMQVVCNGLCGLMYARDKAKKKQKKEDRDKKVSLKTKSEWTKEAQKEFNAFIRYRDKGKPCISCGGLPQSMRRKMLNGHLVDAGHYRSVGSCPELRFEELNCHAQCVRCNRELSGNAVEYRLGLKDRIRHEELEWLEGPHDLPKWTVDDLKRIKSEYKSKLKELKCLDES
jgi:hypothetical protein